MSLTPEGDPIDHIAYTPPNPYWSRNRTEEPAIADMLAQWTRSLPPSEGGIIDLSAGPGSDIASLHALGFQVVAQDADPVMVTQSKIPSNTRLGDVTRLPDPDTYFSGAICKDTLVFLSPWQRTQMFYEVHRTLVPSGRLWVLSEVSGENCAYIKSDRKIYSFIDISLRVAQDSRETYEEWIQKVKHKCGKRGIIDTIHYAVDPAEFCQLGTQTGFRVVSYTRHESHSAIARQNRWSRGGIAYDLFEFEK